MEPLAPNNPPPAHPPQPSIAEIFSTFFKIGITSFGGGLVAYVQDALVSEKKWMSDSEFLAALEIGQTLPGLNSVNISIIAGRKLHGPLGATAAAVGLILPGVVLLVALGVLYFQLHGNPKVAAALTGATAAAVGLLLQITLKIGGKQFLKLKDLAFILLAFYFVGILHLSLLSTLFILVPIAIWIHRPPHARKNPPPPTAKNPSSK